MSAEAAFTDWLADQRDSARGIAVVLEQQIAAVDRRHKNHRSCRRHGIAGHDCGSGWWFRCYVCRQQDQSYPCGTWQDTHPEVSDA